MGNKEKFDGETSVKAVFLPTIQRIAFFPEYWSHLQTKADTGPSTHHKEMLSMQKGGHQISPCYFMPSFWPNPYLLGL